MKRKLITILRDVRTWIVQLVEPRMIRAQDNFASRIHVYLKGAVVTDYTTACWVPVQPGKTWLGWVDLIGTKKNQTAKVGPDGKVIIQRNWGRVRWEWK